MTRAVALFLRLALATAFLSAVADRLGLWGPPGAVGVAWGDFARFTDSTAALNPWAPAVLVPVLAWIATGLEAVLGAALILGLGTRWAARASGLLLLAFALAMSATGSLKGALDYSVFTAAAGALALSMLPDTGPGLDRLWTRPPAD